MFDDLPFAHRIVPMCKRLNAVVAKALARSQLARVGIDIRNAKNYTVQEALTIITLSLALYLVSSQTAPARSVEPRDAPDEECCASIEKKKTQFLN